MVLKIHGDGGEVSMLWETVIGSYSARTSGAEASNLEIGETAIGRLPSPPCWPILYCFAEDLRLGADKNKIRRPTGGQERAILFFLLVGVQVKRGDSGKREWSLPSDRVLQYASLEMLTV